MISPEAQLATFYFDLAVSKLEKARQGRVRIAIVHRYGVKSSYARIAERCVLGEEIASAWIIFRGRAIELPLSTPHLLLFDYLCRYCRGLGQHAAEIEAGFNEKLWYIHHASSAKRRGMVLARSTRTSIRKQVERIRKAMAVLFAQEQWPLHPEQILYSQPTSTLQVKYSIRADVTIEH